MKNSKLVVVLVLAIILTGAGVLRLYDLEEESLWLDECFTLNYGSQSIDGLVETLKNDVHPIGYYLPQHLLIDYFGTGEITLRILSVFFGVLSVFLTYLLARKLFSWKEGLLAAFFMAVSYTSILYSQEAKMYSMFGAFFLLSLISFIRFLKRPSLLNILFFSISAVLLLYSHIIGLVVLFCYILLYLTGYMLLQNKMERPHFISRVIPGKKFYLARFMAAFGLILLLYLPWLKMLVFYQLPLLYISLGSKLIEKLGFNLLPVVAGIAIFFILLYVVGLYLIITGKIKFMVWERLKNIFVIFTNEKIIFWLLFCFLIFDFWLSRSLFSSVHIIRFSFFLLPPCYILLSWILLLMKRNNLATIFLILFVISASFELYKYYNLDSKEQFREAAEYIESHASAADVLFLHRATIAKQCFDYYYSENVEEVRLITPGEDDHLLIERASGKRDAYLILSHNYHTKDYFKQKMDSLYEFKEEKKFIGVTVYRYEVSGDSNH